MRKTIIALMGATLFVSACAQQPDAVVATPVSSMQYQNKTCRALAIEEQAIATRVNSLTGAQKQKADQDGAAVAIGMILFWPALFALSAGSDQSAALSQAKGEYDAIQTAKAQKRC